MKRIGYINYDDDDYEFEDNSPEYFDRYQEYDTTMEETVEDPNQVVTQVFTEVRLFGLKILTITKRYD